MNVFKQARLLAFAAALALGACSGQKGPAGAAGASGSSCSATGNADGTATITCTDGTSATVSKGGAGPAGQDGKSCTVTDNANGTSTISCADGTSAVVHNGQDGAGCVVATNADGSRTITCGDGSTATIFNGVSDYALMSDAEKADASPSMVVTDVTVPADGRALVTLKVSDRKGNGLKNLSPAAPATVSWRFGLLKLAAGVNGSANDTWINYNGTATSTASAETASATTLTDNGDGTYTFRFTKNVLDATAANRATTYDPAAPHRVVVILSKSVSSRNVFQPVNVVRDFVPANGFAADITGQNDKVDPASCLECHTRFRAPAGGTSAFHGGARYDVRSCVACHNDQSRFVAVPGTGSTPLANDASIAADGKWTGNLAILNGESVFNLPVFIHKIHMGEELTLKGGNYRAVSMPYETRYPQDVRNCAKCHRSPAGQVTKADNWKTQPSRRACGACHDGVSFAAAVPAGRVAHSGGAFADDAACSGCHQPVGAFAGIATKHVAVAPPDPNSTYAGGTNANTNAAYLAAAGAVPAGAAVITYDVGAVSTWTDTSVTPNVQRPQVTFKLKKDGADVVFNTFAAGVTTELITDFVGSPSVYFAYAVPQDGIATPADFNATASGYIKNIWNGTATGAGAGTITGPDGTGYYTIQLTGVVVPATATMLTGGLGYTYSLASTQPLTQTNVPNYGYDTVTKIGGLIVPAPDVWKVGTGYTARRTIVANAKCNACHAALGASPTFHAGQRNDAPTCSFCHNPNRTSSAWSANAKDFVHGIHGAAKRTQDFTWHATSLPGGAGEGFWQATYPAVLNNCEMCHLPGTYDFSASAAAAAVPNMLASTVGTGTYTAPAAGTFNGISPYVALGTAYGTGFSATAAGVITDAAATTLVKTPITAACSACHDAPLAIDHMESNGGAFYKPRSAALPSAEQCLICHGPGKIAAVGDVHK